MTLVLLFIAITFTYASAKLKTDAGKSTIKSSKIIYQCLSNTKNRSTQAKD